MSGDNLKHGYPVKRLMALLQNDPFVTIIVYTSALFQPFSETFPEDRFFFIAPSVDEQTGIKPPVPIPSDFTVSAYVRQTEVL